MPTAWYQDARIGGWRENRVFRLGSGEVVVAYEDRTAAVRSAEELLRSEVRYRRIVETAEEGIWEMDARFRTTFANRRMAALLETEPAAMLGRPVTDFMFPEDAADHRERMGHRQAARSERYARRFRTAGGEEIWTLVSATPLLDEQGTFAGSFAMFTDITDRVRGEAELMRGNERLRELTARLHAAREDERTTLSRRLHDEVGQLLTALKLDLALLRRAPGAADEADRLREAEETADRALQTVRDLSADLRPAPLDHLGLTTALAWEAQRFARRTGVQAVVEAEGGDLLDHLAATALYRIAQEALTNVARHARAASVRILWRREPGEARLAVVDDGCGIDPARIRDPDALGLLGMRERAAAVGARLSVGPEPGGGTRVEVRLPVGEEAASP